MVTHPNVCRLHDLEDTVDGCFITMEHIAGEPLSARLVRRSARFSDSAAPRATATLFLG
jgi:hypothetical protein